MRRLFLIIIGIVNILLTHAQSVSKEIATKVAIQYMENHISDEAPVNYAMLSKDKGINTAYTHIMSITGRAPLYLIQLSEGWILVASEYIETPVLASANFGQFPSVEEMPDGMKWLISYYEEGMQYIRDSVLERSEIRRTWDPIYESANSPNNRATNLPESYEIPNISSIRWNQSGNNSGYWPDCNKVYDKYCPTWYTPTFCNHTYAGCTAIAMSVVMRYFQWPYSAIIPDEIDSSAHISGTKHLETYSWEKMPYAIYNNTDEENANEIAGFLRDCGYASKMKYGRDGSGTSLDNAKNALLNNFHYAGIGCYSRWWFIGNWINKLKSEIAANRPVIYAGYNENGGHAFVLYGYTASNKFKINWGWGGSYNGGEFTLDSIKPYPLHPGYPNSQEALWNITPKYPNCGSYMVSSSDVNQTNFEIYRGGNITLQNVTMPSGKSGVIYSGEGVRLTSGAHIAYGANVRIGIKNMHCDNRGESIEEENLPSYRHVRKERNIKNHGLAISPNPVSDVLTITADCDLESATIYTLDGQCLLQTNEKQINVSLFPAGIYILRAKTRDGEFLQTKFIHQ